MNSDQPTAEMVKVTRSHDNGKQPWRACPMYIGLCDIFCFCYCGLFSTCVHADKEHHA